MAKDKDDSISIGPIGPIEIVPEDDPRREAGRRAARIAQAAVDRDQLIDLVVHHIDALVREEAVPRLKARFPADEEAHKALITAVSDQDVGVRCAAVAAVGDLAIPGAGDLLATALVDPEPDVRFFAAIGLQGLDDPRAPVDPEAYAYRSQDS